jgi:hypothetical protein
MEDYAPRPHASAPRGFAAEVFFKLSMGQVDDAAAKSMRCRIFFQKTEHEAGKQI